MLFAHPLREITFADLNAFCQTWPEGTRVEYKRVLSTEHIPKVIASFANTVGGIWIIGVKTDGSNRAVFPIEGFPRETGIEERVTQSCYANLYPALLPEVHTIDVPNHPDNVVVVVRVSESIEAPHAIENTTRVYIRTNSTTERIELAEIDRIDYLLKRRREGEQKREEMLSRLMSYSPLFPQKIVRFTIGPQYPYKPILTRDELTNRIRSLPNVYISHYSIPIREGYMAPAPYIGAPAVEQLYFAANFHGMIVYEQPLERLKRPDKPDKDFIDLDNICLFISNGIQIAKILLAGTATNLKLEVGMEGIALCTVVFTIQSQRHFSDSLSLDKISKAEVTLTREKLEDAHGPTQLMIELIYQLMWPFNWHDRQRITEYIRNYLGGDRPGNS